MLMPLACCLCLTAPWVSGKQPEEFDSDIFVTSYAQACALPFSVRFSHKGPHVLERIELLALDIDSVVIDGHPVLIRGRIFPDFFEPPNVEVEGSMFTYTYQITDHMLVATKWGEKPGDEPEFGRIDFPRKWKTATFFYRIRFPDGRFSSPYILRVTRFAWVVDDN